MNPESRRKQLADHAGKILVQTPARKRMAALFDADTFVEIDAFSGAKEQSCGVVTGYGYIGDTLAYAFSQDVSADDGAVTKAHAKKISKLYDLAVKTGCPVIAVFDSKGAKLSEANEMLDAYGEILAKSSRLSGVVPQVAVVLGTCAGTSALLACGADFLVMSKQAELFMTAPFVTKALGEDEAAGTAEFIAQSGLASVVAENEDAAMEEARKILSMLPANNLSPAPLFEAQENAKGVAALKKEYKNIDKMSGLAVIEAVADAGSVIVLQKEFGTGMAAALGTVGGAAVGFLANDEGNGQLGIDECDKATRLIRTCDAFHLPVITFVNTKGFQMTANPVLIRKSARLAHAYSESTTQKVTVLCGQAVGAAYMALAANANADLTLAWPTAAISALGLEATVEFLSHDKLKGTKNLEQSRKELVEEYIDTTAGALKAAENGYVDNVIEPESTRVEIIKAIEMLAGKRESTLPKKHSVMPL